ncbi:glycosyltransferase family 4 protein [Bosea sp. 124]|uniref:glycosyltransferase family 4 protein n=1 Tax=Bosea sp. 124 TaxID=2135642 RepID=UPI000D3B742A|nr:glycosyltransferase family 4 protein [Bosea sp. 124]PTM40892.1 glycosyltransferase involved in cell wall biosynthesis [Bosea sp. 124]
MRIAFHTPLNAYDDGRISGDRRMALQLVAVLEGLGHVVEPVLAARDFMPSADADRLSRHRDAAATHAQDMLARWQGGAPPPELWFTYHNYYKAPDLLGPAIVKRLNIPYVVAEASDAKRRASGEWAAHTQIARNGFAAADLHLHFTDRDRQGLEPWRAPHTALLELPPFIAFADDPPQHAGDAMVPRLVTVAMMREGTKQNSYLTLARILGRVVDRPWTLTIIGDGRQRAAIEQAFADLPEGRIRWQGALPHERVVAEMAAHDVFIWPGVREAYGLVYLEAQAVGLPIVAFDSGGVAATVRSGETALLAPEGDEAALATALLNLLDDRALRRTMGAAARRFALIERNPAKAALILERGLALAVANRAARAVAAEPAP